MCILPGWSRRQMVSALAVGVVLVCLLAGGPTTLAQGPVDAPQGDTSTEPPDASEPEQPQTVYIPYTKLREVFEREGRGVFLPYTEFQKLWDASREKPTAPAPGPPVDALITEVENEAVIEQDVVRVSARLTIELMKKGWLHIPLRLNNAALQSAKIDGQVARILAAPAGGYELLLKNDQDQPHSIQLQLEYAQAFTKAPGKNSVSFEAPQAPVNRWRISVPQAGVKINVQPMIAASEAPMLEGDDPPANSNKEDQPSDLAPAREESIVLAFVGAAPQVGIEWTPKAEGAAGMTALATVQSTQEVFIAEGTLRTRVSLKYDISRSTLNQLTVEVPSDFKVVNVFDANLRKWNVSPEADHQRIDLELFEPATASQAISIELEKLTEQKAQAELQIPVVKAIDVGRQQGIVVVNVDPALRAEVVGRTSLLQLDAAELPANLSSQTWSFAYRYAALPFDLRLSLVKVEPRVTLEQFIEATLQPQQIHLDVLALFDVAEAGIFQLEFDLPEDFEVRQVRGQDYPGATAASIDAHHVDGANKNHLVINLSKKALGKTCVVVELERKLDDVNLLSPTGESSTVAFNVPQTSQPFLVRSSGKLLVHSPESLRVNPTDSPGLRVISLSEALVGLQSTVATRYPETRPAMSFAFGDQAASLSLAVERRKPHVTARQRLEVSVDSGVVRYQARFFYDILYSGVKSLRIDVPKEIASSIRNETDGVREFPIDPQPSDVAEGYEAWSLTGQSELVGHHVITLSWEQKIDELAVGKSVELNVPQLKPMGTDRSWGQIVLKKTENLDVQPNRDLSGLRAIDPQHDVMADAVVEGAARAFEYHADWSLKLDVTRYQLEEIKRTSIERALVRMVVTRSSLVGVQALYRLRSAQQRLTIHLPDGVEFDSQPARINGRPIALERGEKDDLYLPLAGHDPDEPIVLELRFTVSGSSKQMDLPSFPDDPAVQKVYLSLFLPTELALIRWNGPWSEEWRWQSIDSSPTQALANQTDSELENWVTEGVKISGSPPFQRDGTRYVFSALKPEPPPRGSLSITTISNTYLSGLVFFLLAGFAFALLRASPKTKTIAIVCLVIAALLCGVFAPNLTHQLFRWSTAAGLAAVALIWFGSWMVDVAANNRRLAALPSFVPDTTPEEVSPDGTSEVSPSNRRDTASETTADTPSDVGPRKAGSDEHE